jgi:AGCS family alanine or glycine:cation symporter
MLTLVDKLYNIVWGAPTLLLILVTGLLLSIRTGFAQFRLFPRAWSDFVATLFRRRKTKREITSFQALCTALAATVGIGNLAGVAGAIALGGPGSIFWMWISALLGMVIKFAEATLAVHFRFRGEDGAWLGGPMHIISRGMGKRWIWLACIYSFFGVVAAFGVGNATQINAVVASVRAAASGFGLELSRLWDLVIGIFLALLIGAALRGGAKRIASAAEKLIPFAAGGYILLCLVALLVRYDRIPGAFVSILTGAFSPRAVTGGMIGSAFLALRTGVSRGVFTNEAGMGTASIAHAGAQVDHPVRQGLMGIMEVFLDTIVICTMTALVILCSGVPIEYGTDHGALLTSAAFTCVLGDWASIAISLAVSLFAFATVLGWGLYGARCAQFLFGQDAWRKFSYAQIVAVILGAVMRTGTLWRMAEVVNGLMAIPNLVALWVMLPTLIQLIYDFNCGSVAADGGTYENFHQCESL